MLMPNKRERRRCTLVIPVQELNVGWKDIAKKICIYQLRKYGLTAS